jgi:hypothetical protein
MHKEYWGADAIVKRLGFRASQRLNVLIEQYSIPAWKRFNPKKPTNQIYYASEEALLKWELAQAQACRERLIAERAERRARRAMKATKGFRAA